MIKKHADKSKEELIQEIEELREKNRNLQNMAEHYSAQQQMAEKRFQDFIDKHPMPIQILDMEGYTIQVNPAHTKIFGVVPPPNYCVFTDPQLLNKGFGKKFEQIKKGEVVQLPLIQYNANDVDPAFPNIPLWLKSIGFTLDNNTGKPERIVISHDNITQNKLSEEKIKESNKMLELVMNSIPQFIFWKDCNSVYLGCNENFAKVAGFQSTNEIVGKTDYDLAWKKEEADFFVECDRKVISSGIAEYHIIEPQLQADGKQAWLDTNKVPIFDEAGIVIGILGTYEDITQRKLIEFALQESELQFRNLFENAADAIFIANKESGRIVDANQAAERLIQLPYNKIIGIKQKDLHPASIETYSIQTFHQQIKEVTAFMNTLPIENKVLRADGTEVPVEVLATEVFYKGQHCIMGTFRDITERKKAELEIIKAKEQAVENEMKFSKVFHISPEPQTVTSLEDGRFVMVNEAFLKYSGFSKEEVIGHTSAEINAWVNPDSRLKWLDDLTKNGSVRALEIPFRTKKFGIRDYLVSSDILELYGEKCTINIYLDITERKIIEEELTKAKEHAEESDRLKSAFLQNMSHEIRTPMNAIMGFSDLMVSNFDNKAKLEKFSNIIGQRCRDLLDIINDILDISKIESGQLTVNYEECNLNELFAELSSFFGEYQIRLNKQHIQFTLQAFCLPHDCIIVTDKVKLKQIFINLLGNAFKFTDKGFIEGGCRYDENNRLLFYVTDTGRGIPADKYKFVFERFSQLHVGSNLNIGGTGLGLPIVKGLIRLLGGEITIESEPQKGTSFYFSFPIHTTKTLVHKKPLTETTKEIIQLNKTILVVEDDLYNAEYLKEILTGKGLLMLHTTLGKDSVEIAVNQAIDLVLMDIRLPDINGYEATREILKVKPDLKIIAQTAYAAEEEQQKSMEAGCIDYISKPTPKGTLLKLIGKYLK